MINIGDIAITSLDTITSFGLDGTYNFTLDELQNAKIANTQEKTDITGKGGRKLNSLKKNKAVVISGTNGLLSGGLLEAQTGSEFKEVDKAPVLWTEYLTVGNANTVNTGYKAVGTEGKEIKNLYIRNADGTLGKKLTQAADAAATGKFTYAPATKLLTFDATDCPEGTEIVVMYERNIKANVLENVSDVFSKKAQLYVDATGEDKCGNVYRIQFYIPKADFAGNFDFDLGGDQVVHAFEAESLAGACGAGGSLWTYTIFGVGEGDAA